MNSFQNNFNRSEQILHWKSNKKIYNDKRSSIENLHDEKINDIISKENTLPELKQRLVNLKNLLSMLEKNKNIYKINETKKEQVAQGQYVVSDTRCPDCMFVNVGDGKQGSSPEEDDAL